MKLADLLGVPHTLEHNGQKYELSPLTQEGKARYSRWLEARARADAGRANDLPEDEQNAYMRNVSRDITTGMYEWDGPLSIQSLQTPCGMKYVIYLMLRTKHSDMTEELAAEIVMAKIAEIGAILQSKTDPKARAPKKGRRPK